MNPCMNLAYAIILIIDRNFSKGVSLEYPRYTYASNFVPVHQTTILLRTKFTQCNISDKMWNE